MSKKEITNRKDVLVKYVGRAKLWCRTYWDENGNQIQEWFFDKELTLPIKK